EGVGDEGHGAQRVRLGIIRGLSQTRGKNMTQDELKALVGQAALEYVVPGSIVGVGTGSTVNCFIDALASMKDRIQGAVSSSERSTERLRSHGIAVLDSNAVEGIPVYFDGSDVTDHARNMI